MESFVLRWIYNTFKMLLIPQSKGLFWLSERLLSISSAHFNLHLVPGEKSGTIRAEEMPSWESCFKRSARGPVPHCPRWWLQKKKRRKKKQTSKLDWSCACFCFPSLTNGGISDGDAAPAASPVHSRSLNVPHKRSVGWKKSPLTTAQTSDSQGRDMISCQWKWASIRMKNTVRHIHSEFHLCPFMRKMKVNWIWMCFCFFWGGIVAPKVHKATFNLWASARISTWLSCEAKCSGPMSKS